MSERLICPIDNNLYPAHGGSRHALMEGLGIPDEQVIDFSASVNLLGCSPGVLSALDDLGRLISEYPESGSLIFCEKVSEYLKIPSEWVLAANGSTELIHLLPRLLESGNEGLILNPCFSEYERALRLNRFSANSMLYEADSSFQINPERVIRYLHQQPLIQMLVLGHPNNPTGHLWDEDSLGALVHYCKAQKIILVVDETFIEFCPESVSVLKWMQNNPFLIVVRSMTKFFGLAGVRLGYGIMHPNLRNRLKEYQIPWSVNALAQKMGVAALEDRPYAIQIREMVDKQRTRLFSGLGAIPGIRVFPSQTNFLLFQLVTDTAEDAHQFYVGLLKDGILIRNCGNFRGLDKSYFRVAARTEKDNRVLVSRIKAQVGKDG